MACNKCYQKSSLVAVTTRDLTVATGDYVEFDVNRVKTGISIAHTEGSGIIRLNGAGLYLIAFDCDFDVETSGAVSVQLYDRGVAVLGAEATAQAVADTPRNLHFTTLIDVKPSCCAIDNSSVLNIQISAAGTIINANITVVKQA